MANWWCVGKYSILDPIRSHYEETLNERADGMYSSTLAHPSEAYNFAGVGEMDYLSKTRQLIEDQTNAFSL